MEENVVCPLFTLLIFAALSLGSATSVAAAPVNSESPSPPSNNGDESSAQFPTQFDKESDKGPVFQYYARKLPNLTYPSEPRDSKDDVDFCQDMGKDLRTLHGITFVEPTAKGKTIDDPAVRAYWPRCAKLEPGYDSFSDITIPLYYWNGSVTLYKVDYQNGMAANQDILLNYAPGSEPLLLFFERACNPDVKSSRSRCIGSFFHAVDPDQCKVLETQTMGGGQIWIDEYKYNLNAVMRYKGLVWLIGVSDNFAHGRYLTAAANGPVKPVHICSFSEWAK